MDIFWSCLRARLAVMRRNRAKTCLRVNSVSHESQIHTFLNTSFIKNYSISKTNFRMFLLNEVNTISRGTIYPAVIRI
jgi:hypothetical protein